MPDFYITTEAEKELAILVAAEVSGSRPLMSMEDSLAELALLADTAGIQVVGQVTQNVKNINPSTYVGSGKLEEVAEKLVETGAKVVIFDDELSPRHQREIEKRVGQEIKVIDRSALILDIFAQHAQTREGALQVELAQYEYRKPRLTRQWTHLARQGGGKGSSAGVGLRGPGETQLEVDQREISRKIDKLKRDLDVVRAHRSRQRTQRARSGFPIVALVGYTNAGKSTLINTLTNASTYVADQLFATLDPTTRKLDLVSGRQAIVTDTVGFIQKLPTTLIAAFRATLEEILEADMLLHVVDLSHPNVIQHIEAVEDTLAELEISPNIPRILVWNKADLWQGDDLPFVPDQRYYLDAVVISAHQRRGIDTLLSAIERALAQTQRTVKLFIPHARGEIVSAIYQHATVIDRQDDAEGVRLTLKASTALSDYYEEFRVG